MGSLRVRRLAAATALVATPVLGLAAGLVLPWRGNDGTLAALRVAGDNPTATQIGGLLLFLCFLATIPATLALMRILDSDAPTLALVGGSLQILGAASGAVIVLMDQFNVMLASSALPRAEVAAALEDSSGWVVMVMLAVFLIGILGGALVLGFGFLRSATVPTWIGAAFIVGPVLSFAANAILSSKPVDLASGVLFLAAMVPLARRVFNTSDVDWDRGGVAEVVAPNRAVSVPS